MSSPPPPDARYVEGPFLLADATTVVETDDPAFARIVRWVFHDLRCVGPVDPDPGGISLRFEVLRDRDAPGRWGIWRDGEPCETTLIEGYVLFHLQWEFNRVVLERRSHTVHAAAVELSGWAFAFCGSTMSGKTTLAGWLASHGAGFIADEIVAVSADGRALPYRRPLGLRHGGPLEGLFSIPTDLDRRFTDYESLVPVGALGPQVRLARDAPLGAIVFTTYRPGEATELTVVPKGLALEKLCGNAPGLGRHGRSAFRFLSSLVREVATLDLQISDLGEAERLLRDTARALRAQQNATTAATPRPVGSDRTGAC